MDLTHMLLVLAAASISYSQPSREKLLPDWHSIPNIPPDAPCPPTLVIDLEVRGKYWGVDRFQWLAL